MTSQPFTIRPLAADERDAACAVMGAAFADNPSTLANVDGDARRAQRTIEAVTRVVKLANPFSAALVAERDGTIVGVLNATPSSHCQPRAADKLRAAVPLALALRTALPRVMSMAAARARHDPEFDHWHIGPVGVVPTVQGQGAGSALLGAFLQRADTEDVPAFLETDVDRNVVLYERFGFKIVDRQTIQGVDTRFMLRAPRADS
jgi:GNAT superfamily N-acetyltransferase